MRPFLLVAAALQTAAFSPPRTYLGNKPHATATTFARGGSLAAASRDELIGEATGTAILLTFGYGAVAHHRKLTHAYISPLRSLH